MILRVFLCLPAWRILEQQSDSQHSSAQSPMKEGLGAGRMPEAS